MTAETPETSTCPQCGKPYLALVEAWDRGTEIIEGEYCRVADGWPRRYYIHR